VIAHDIIDRNAHGKGHAPIDDLTGNLFGKELGRLRDNDSPSEFTNVNNGGSREALRDDSLQSEIDNLGRFLVLGADVTEQLV
jgi:hypothetical protein